MVSSVLVRGQNGWLSSSHFGFFPPTGTGQSGADFERLYFDHYVFSVRLLNQSWNTPRFVWGKIMPKLLPVASIQPNQGQPRVGTRLTFSISNRFCAVSDSDVQLECLEQSRRRICFSQSWYFRKVYERTWLQPFMATKKMRPEAPAEKNKFQKGDLWQKTH